MRWRAHSLTTWEALFIHWTKEKHRSFIFGLRLLVAPIIAVLSAGATTICKTQRYPRVFRHSFVARKEEIFQDIFAFIFTKLDVTVF
jgi:hypothetical protein